MKRFKDGTSGFTGGPQRTTWMSPSLPVRLVGFSLAVVAFAFLIVRIDRNIWLAQGHLQEGFAAIKAEKFYFGVNFRVRLRKLSDTLLDYHLSGNPADLQNFRQEAGDLKSWLQTRKAGFVEPDERDAFAKLEASYGGFLERVDPLQRGNGSAPVDRAHFATAYEQLTRDYQPVLNACDEVVQSEHGAFDAFLTEIRSRTAFAPAAFPAVAAAAGCPRGGLGFAGLSRHDCARCAPSLARARPSSRARRNWPRWARWARASRTKSETRSRPSSFGSSACRRPCRPSFAENEDARTISEELNRLDRIVKDFLQFARPSEPELVRVPAERILQEVQEFMKSELEQAAIDLKLEVSQPAWILADTHQLKQVLINLIQNSADSIGKNGVITLGLKTGAGNVRWEAPARRHPIRRGYGQGHSGGGSEAAF